MDIDRVALSIDAHCVDEQFENTILADFGVKITDRSNEPWTVVFEGTKENLLKMVQAHWDDSFTEDQLVFDPIVAK